MADFLASLSPAQWEEPSLCPGRRIRDVAAHVISYEEHIGADLVRRLAKARFRPGRLNDVALARSGRGRSHGPGRTRRSGRRAHQTRRCRPPAAARLMTRRTVHRDGITATRQLLELPHAPGC